MDISLSDKVYEKVNAFVNHKVTRRVYSQVCSYINQFWLCSGLAFAFCSEKFHEFGYNYFVGSQFTDLTHSKIVTYRYNGNNYAFCFPKVRKIRTIEKAIDQDGKDITELIFELLGPYHDFHNTKISPIMLGFTKITLTYRNGTIAEFYDSSSLAADS